jgi:uncharacterized membrane protein YkgB
VIPSMGYMYRRNNERYPLNRAIDGSPEYRNYKTANSYITQ